MLHSNNSAQFIAEHFDGLPDQSLEITYDNTTHEVTISSSYRKQDGTNGNYVLAYITYKICVTIPCY